MYNLEEGTSKGESHWTLKQTADQQNLKSAIMDHCRRNNHIMDWDKGKTVRSGTNQLKGWIKEAIERRGRAIVTANWQNCQAGNTKGRESRGTWQLNFIKPWNDKAPIDFATGHGLCYCIGSYTMALNPGRMSFLVTFNAVCVGVSSHELAWICVLV